MADAHPSDDPITALLRGAASGTDRRAAAVHEAGHVLALVARGVAIEKVSTWSDDPSDAAAAWSGQTDSASTDHLSVHDNLMVALAGAAAEKAMLAASKTDADAARQSLGRPPAFADIDYELAARVIWKDLHPGEDPPDGYLRDPAVTERIAGSWPEITAEMSAQLDALNSFADTLMEHPAAFAISGPDATAAATALVAPDES